MRRSIFLGAVSAVAMIASANAADIYVPTAPGGYKDPVYFPVATWAGFYAGVNGGYGWSARDSKLDGTDSRPCTRQEFDGFVPGVVCTKTPGGPQFGSVSDTETKRFGTSGGFGGGQIGYNWQPVSSGGYKDGPVMGRFVFGIEADIQGSGIEGRSSLSFLGGTGSATGKNDLEWFGTVRGRLGYAFDQTLVYATGGFAFGGVKDTLTLTPTVGTAATLRSNTTETGYVVGGGIERLITPAWSVKVEYQYIDLGSDKLAITSGGASATLDAEHAYHTVRVGLNYHIHQGYEPLK